MDGEPEGTSWRSLSTVKQQTRCHSQPPVLQLLAENTFPHSHSHFPSINTLAAAAAWNKAGVGRDSPINSRHDAGTASKDKISARWSHSFFSILKIYFQKSFLSSSVFLISNQRDGNKSWILIQTVIWTSCDHTCDSHSKNDGNAVPPQQRQKGLNGPTGDGMPLTTPLQYCYHNNQKERKRSISTHFLGSTKNYTTTTTTEI